MGTDLNNMMEPYCRSDVWTGWTWCKNKKMEEMKDRHGCGIHAKSNKFHRDGQKNLRGTMAKQSGVSMETALWLIAHKYIEKSDNVWPCRVRCHWLLCLEDLQIYEMSVYLLKKKVLKSFFCECVSVDQRCLDRETLIYDIWHQLWLNHTWCPWLWHHHGWPHTMRAFF